MKFKLENRPTALEARWAVQIREMSLAYLVSSSAALMPQA
jgi:hypothetical protein